MLPAKEVLHRVTVLLDGAESVQDTYNAVVSIGQSEVGAEASALFVEDETREVLRVVAADGYGKNLLNGAATYEKEEGITGQVWNTGETVKCDTHEEMVNHPWRKGKFDELQWTKSKKCHNLLFVPLRRNEHVFGVWKVENKKVGDQYTPFTEADVELLETIAAAVSLAVGHALLDERRIKRPNQNEFIASVVHYRSEEVEAFLHVDPRHYDGPIIYRDGRSAPRMKVDEWFRAHSDAWQDLPRTVRTRYGAPERFLASLQERGGFSTDPDEWPRGLPIDEHWRRIEAAFRGVKRRAMQGAGDTTMNLYSIAILDGRLIVPPEERQRVLDMQRRDPNSTPNVYSCLVKINRGMSRLSIRDVEINFNHDPPRVTLYNRDGTKSKLGLADIEFAVYGQQLIRDGQLVPMEKIVHQFPDIRHVFSVVELDGQFFGSDKKEKHYFGEAQFFDDPGLCTRALTEPVILDARYTPKGMDTPLGADPAHVIARLFQAGYDEVIGRDPTQPGEFCRPGRGSSEFVIFLKPAYYPLTMVGLDRTRETLFLMAISGQSGRFSLTVPNAARLLRDRFGVYDALLMDEGVDVFQQVGGQQPVQMNRRQVRAVIAVGSRS